MPVKGLVVCLLLGACTPLGSFDHMSSHRPMSPEPDNCGTPEHFHACVRTTRSPQRQPQQRPYVVFRPPAHPPLAEERLPVIETPSPLEEMEDPSLL